MEKYWKNEIVKEKTDYFQKDMKKSGYAHRF